jgi:HSP20 family protein
MSFQDMILTSLNNLQSDGDLRGAFQHLINSGITGSASEKCWHPPVDIVDTPNNMYIYVELPGVCKDSIDVDFFNNNLTITGEKLKMYKDEPIKNEIVYGHFTRKINVNISVTNKNHVNINYESGVLSVIIDKKKEEKNRFHIGITEKNSIPENVD